MKQLFFLLLFLNVVYFFWGQTAIKKNVVIDYQKPLYENTQLEKLELISKEELSRMSNKKPAIASEIDKATMEAPSECYRVGNFETEQDANDLLNELSGLDGRMQLIPFIVSKEYWVVYPSNGDWSQSLQNLKQLKAKGLTDIWLVPKGEYKGLISLGLFKMAERAKDRLKKLAKKQIKAEIINRERFHYGVKVEINGSKAKIQDELDRLEVAQQQSIDKISC